MSEINKLSIVMPAYNEKNSIEEIIKQVLKVRLEKIIKEIIVVDDGSTDETYEIVSNLQKRNKEIILIKHTENRGKGAAVRTGIKSATGSIIIIQDADLEYDPIDYNQCIEPIVKGEAKVVYGSRILEQRKNPTNWLFRGKHKNAGFFAYVGGCVVSLFTNILFFAKLTDEPTCYKTFDAKLIKKIKIRSEGFEWEPEVTAKILKKGEKIIEVPIGYRPRSVKEGKKINWKDGFKALFTLLKYRFN